MSQDALSFRCPLCARAELGLWVCGGHTRGGPEGAGLLPGGPAWTSWLRWVSQVPPHQVEVSSLWDSEDGGPPPGGAQSTYDLEFVHGTGVTSALPGFQSFTGPGCVGSDFGTFAYTQGGILGMGPESEHERDSCFTGAAFTQPEGNFTVHFMCATSLILTVTCDLPHEVRCGVFVSATGFGAGGCGLARL
jgi:hypothetical protein